MILLAASALELLAFEIQALYNVPNTLRRFRARRKAIIRRWKLAPFYVVSDN